jgi:hypothetical protein
MAGTAAASAQARMSAAAQMLDSASAYDKPVREAKWTEARVIGGSAPLATGRALPKHKPNLSQVRAERVLFAGAKAPAKLPICTLHNS